MMFVCDVRRDHFRWWKKEKKFVVNKLLLLKEMYMGEREKLIIVRQSHTVLKIHKSSAQVLQWARCRGDDNFMNICFAILSIHVRLLVTVEKIIKAWHVECVSYYIWAEYVNHACLLSFNFQTWYWYWMVFCKTSAFHLTRTRSLCNIQSIETQQTVYCQFHQKL